MATLSGLRVWHLPGALGKSGGQIFMRTRRIGVYPRRFVSPIGWRPVHVLVERIGRARNPLPLAALEDGGCQALGIDLVDILGRKPRDEARAEVAARLDYHRRCLADV